MAAGIRTQLLVHILDCVPHCHGTICTRNDSVWVLAVGYGSTVSLLASVARDKQDWTRHTGGAAWDDVRGPLHMQAI